MPSPSVPLIGVADTNVAPVRSGPRQPASASVSFEASAPPPSKGAKSWSRCCPSRVYSMRATMVPLPSAFTFTVVTASRHAEETSAATSTGTIRSVFISHILGGLSRPLGELALW